MFLTNTKDPEAMPLDPRDKYMDPSDIAGNHPKFPGPDKPSIPSPIKNEEPPKEIVTPESKIQKFQLQIVGLQVLNFLKGKGIGINPEIASIQAKLNQKDNLDIIQIFEIGDNIDRITKALGYKKEELEQATQIAQNLSTEKITLETITQALDKPNKHKEFEKGDKEVMDNILKTLPEGNESERVKGFVESVAGQMVDNEKSKHKDSDKTTFLDKAYTKLLEIRFRAGLILGELTPDKARAMVMDEEIPVAEREKLLVSLKLRPIDIAKPKTPEVKSVKDPASTQRKEAVADLKTIQEFFLPKETEAKKFKTAEQATSELAQKILEEVSESLKPDKGPLAAEARFEYFQQIVLSQPGIYELEAGERKELYFTLEKSLFGDDPIDSIEEPEDALDFNTRSRYFTYKETLDVAVDARQQKLRADQLDYLITVAEHTNYGEKDKLEQLKKEKRINLEDLKQHDSALNDLLNADLVKKPELKNAIEVAHRNKLIDKLSTNENPIPADILAELKSRDINDLSLFVTDKGYFVLSFQGKNSRVDLAKATMARNARGELIHENLSEAGDSPYLPEAAAYLEQGIILMVKASTPDAKTRQARLLRHEGIHLEREQIKKTELATLEHQVTLKILKRIGLLAKLDLKSKRALQQQLFSDPTSGKRIFDYINGDATALPYYLKPYAKEITEAIHLKNQKPGKESYLEKLAQMYKNTKTQIKTHDHIIQEVSTNVSNWDTASQFFFDSTGINPKDYDTSNESHLTALLLTRYLNENRANLTPEMRTEFAEIFKNMTILHVNIESVAQFLLDFQMRHPGELPDFERLSPAEMDMISEKFGDKYNRENPLLRYLFVGDAERVFSETPREDETDALAPERAKDDKFRKFSREGPIRQMATTIAALKWPKTGLNPFGMTAFLPQVKKWDFIPGTGFNFAQSWAHVLPESWVKFLGSSQTEENQFLNKGLLPFHWGRNDRVNAFTMKFLESSGLMGLMKSMGFRTENIRSYNYHPLLEQFVAEELQGVDVHRQEVMQGILGFKKYGLSEHQVFKLLESVGGFEMDFFRGAPDIRKELWHTSNDEFRQNPSLYYFLLSQGMDPKQIEYLIKPDTMTPLNADGTATDPDPTKRRTLGANEKLKKGQMTDGMLNIMLEIMPKSGQTTDTVSGIHRKESEKKKQEEWKRFRLSMRNIAQAMMREDLKLSAGDKKSNYTLAELIEEIQHTDEIVYPDADSWGLDPKTGKIDPKTGKIDPKTQERVKFKRENDPDETGINPRKYIWIGGDEDGKRTPENRFLVEDARKFVAYFMMAKAYRAIECGLYGNTGSINIVRHGNELEFTQEKYVTNPLYAAQIGKTTKNKELANMIDDGKGGIIPETISPVMTLDEVRTLAPWLTDEAIKEILDGKVDPITGNYITEGLKDGEGLTGFHLYSETAMLKGKNKMQNIDIDIERIERFSPVMIERIFGKIEDHNDDDGEGRYIKDYTQGGLLYHYFDWYDEDRKSTSIWSNYQLRFQEIEIFREQSDNLEKAYLDLVRYERVARYATIFLALMLVPGPLQAYMILGTVGWSFTGTKWVKKQIADWESRLTASEAYGKELKAEMDYWKKFADQRYGTTALNSMIGEQKRIRAGFKRLYNKKAEEVPEAKLNKALKGLFEGVGNINN